MRIRKQQATKLSEVWKTLLVKSKQLYFELSTEFLNRLKLQAKHKIHIKYNSLNHDQSHLIFVNRARFQV